MTIATLSMPTELSGASASLGAVGRASRPSSFFAGDSAFSSFFAGETDGAETMPEQARQAAKEFVAIAFVQPVLKSLRESNNAAEPFAPTQAERAFQPMLDAQIAQRIVERQDYDLVDAVTRQLLRHAQEHFADQPASPERSEVDIHA